MTCILPMAGIAMIAPKLDGLGRFLNGVCMQVFIFTCFQEIYDQEKKRIDCAEDIRLCPKQPILTGASPHLVVGGDQQYALAAGLCRSCTCCTVGKIRRTPPIEKLACD